VTQEPKRQIQKFYALSMDLSDFYSTDDTALTLSDHTTVWERLSVKLWYQLQQCLEAKLESAIESIELFSTQDHNDTAK
jgi:hypothetical protein